MTTFAFSFEPALGLASRLSALTGEALGGAAVRAVNAVAQRFETAAIKAEVAGLNLAESYVRSKTDLVLATNPATPRAEITTRGDLTIIGHYPHQQLRVAGSPVRSGRSRGRRPSGVAVEVKRGAAVFEPQWFTMRLRRGTQAGDNVGLFVRTTAGSVKHIYGPSPYSLFRFQVNAQNQALTDDLESTATEEFANAVTRALS